MVRIDEGMRQTGAEVSESPYHIPFYIALIFDPCKWLHTKI